MRDFNATWPLSCHLGCGGPPAGGVLGVSHEGLSRAKVPSPLHHCPFNPPSPSPSSPRPAVTSQNFDQQEALLARDLAALIADGQYLKHYVAAALRLQGGALLGAADAFGELTSGGVAAAPMPAGPSPGTTPTGAMAAAGMGAAGFGAAGAASSSGVPPAAAVSGPGSHRSMSDGGNPYHTGSLSSGAAKAATLGGAPADTRSYTSGSQHGGATKRYTEPEAGDQYVGTPPKSLDGAPAAGVRYPVAPAAAEQPPSDNPYSSVRYQYA